MTISELANKLVGDPQYCESVMERARSGKLAPEVELLLLELADGRLPIATDRAVPGQSRTLALVRPSTRDEAQP